MRVISTAVIAVTAAVAFALVAGLGSPAAAQYPEPTGAVLLATEDTTPALATDVTITATVLDEAGEAVAGVDCTFDIVQQPGDDATVDAGPATTDADGAVSTTLNTGTSDGTIVVSASCGDATAEVTLVAGESAAPPASLPDTGTGPAEDGAGWSIPAILSVLAIFGLMAVALIRRRVRA